MGFKDRKNKIKDFALLNMGLLLVSGGFYYFLVPNNLAAGGLNGLAMIISKLFSGISISLLLVVMNIILFAIGFIVVGLSFGIKTIYSSFAISGMVWMMEHIYPITVPITGDILFELLLGILTSAIGLALVFNQNASTGGTDIIAKILNKYMYIDIGKALLMSDLVIVLMAFYVYGTETGLYCILAVMMNGLLIDFFIDYINAYNKAVIVSSAANEISEFITEHLGERFVEYGIKDGCNDENEEAIITILSKRQLSELKAFVEKVDLETLILTNKVYKVSGRELKM